MNHIDPTAATLARAAEALLAAALGGPVALGVGEPLQERTYVHRFPLLDAPGGAPPTVIVKGPRPFEGEGQRDASDDDLQGFYNDWAGLQFLSEAAGDARLCPRFLAGDAQRELMVIEDLGEGQGIHTALLGDDSHAAEAALVTLARTLGTMHGRTIGRRSAFDQIRQALGPHIVSPYLRDFGWMATALQTTLDALGLVAAPGTDSDLGCVAVAMSDPGPFLAYTHGDPCPDNCLRVDGQILLIDFERGAFRHALTDGVYGRILFPTCWCVNQLPAATPRLMEQAYRAALLPGCPEAGDDALFGRAVAEGCAYWMLTMCSWHNIPHLLEHDHEWGIATLRQRVLVRSDRFAQTTEELGHLEALGATFRTLAAHLRTRWPQEADLLPLYPAFRGR